MSDFKISLTAARINAGYTQKDVAKQMHINKQTIVNWEKGKVIPKPAQINMMCELYGAPKDCIFLPKR